jgi:hypothetical protein
MKHSCLAPTLLLLCGNISAQIQITSVDMPMVGDEIVRYLDTLPVFTPGGAGPDQSWDFSAAVQDIEQVNTFVDPATTPDGDQFGSSNLAWTTDGSNYSFVTNSTGELALDGFSGDPLGDGTFTVVAPFDPTMTLHQLPRQYNTAFADDFGFDITIDGSGFGLYQARIREVATVNDTTDAFGSITTPVGTYDCIRSRSTTIRIDSIFAQLVEILPMTFLFANVDTTVTYAWHAVETKLPVAEMVLDSSGGALNFTWSSIEPTSTGLTQAPTSDEFRLFPQPAADHVFISSDAPWHSVSVLDMNGREVVRMERVARNEALDISMLPSGAFVLTAVGPQGLRTTRPLLRAAMD